MAPETARLFDSAEQIAKKAGDSYVTAERLLLALALAKGTPSAEILATAGITPQALNGAIEEIRKGPQGDQRECRAGLRLAQEIFRDLTAAARKEAGSSHQPRRGDPPHDQVLSPHQNNPTVLIGEAGVSKTAIVEGPGAPHRQRRCAGGLREKRLLSLDLGPIAGAKFRGEFEGAPQRPSLAEVASAEGEIILFIDELHTLMGRGQGRGRWTPQHAETGARPRRAPLRQRHDAGRVPQACREGRGPRPALQPVFVSEPGVPGPSRSCGPQRKYELHHGVRISDAAIVAAATAPTATSPTVSCRTRLSI
jgi:ATP-dependent Clp protease ATP-binding subunit ClpB